MRSTNLIRIAAQAEAIRIRRFAKRQITRAVLGVIALIFLAAALGSAHAAGYFGLRSVVAPVFAALIVLGVDIVLCLVCVVLAIGNRPSAVEREALVVRRQALVHFGESVALWTVLTPVIRFVPRQTLYTLLLAALTARNLTGGNR